MGQLTSFARQRDRIVTVADRRERNQQGIHSSELRDTGMLMLLSRHFTFAVALDEFALCF